MGYVINGKYYKGKPPLHIMRAEQQSTFKQHDHNRQRQEYAREVIQPFKDGKLNPAFEEAYPEESQSYREKYQDNK